MYDDIDDGGVQFGRTEKSKEEKVLLMAHLIDLIISQGDALCFVRFIMEQMLVPALKTCAKILREGSEMAKTLLLPALWDIHQAIHCE